MKHSTSWRIHLFYDHCIVSKRKWETQSRCPGLRAYSISEPIDRMLISAICMGAPMLSFLSQYPCQLNFRAAVAETLTRHRLPWCNEVQWAGNYSASSRSSNIRPGVITMRSPRLGRMETKTWPCMLFKGCHQKWVCKARNGRGPRPGMLSWTRIS